MHYAVQLQKFDLGEGRVLFKPVNLIKGEYLEYDEIFMDERGFEYWLIKNSSSKCDKYFSSPTTIEDLKTTYGEYLSESEMLDEYLSNFLDYFFLGYQDEEDQITKVIVFDFAEVEKKLNTVLSDKNKKIEFSSTKAEAIDKEEVVEFDPENNERFIFNLESLKELRNYKSIKEVRAYIDKLIETGSYIKENVETNAATEKKKEEKKNYKLDKNGSQKYNLNEIRELILEDVFEQDKAVYDITREIFINETSTNPRNKSHILVTGPTGTGKTEIIRKLCKIYDKPFFVADANQYTKDGYVGKSVSSMILGLIDAANGDIEKAQRGIIAIDEIDKKLSGDKDDVGGLAVLNAMLKITEGDMVEIDAGEPGRRKMILFDTSNLNIIFMGAFEALYNKKLNENNSFMGFNSERKEITKREIKITKDDLIKEGFPAELLGRIGGFTSTYSFDEDGLVNLLNNSKISPLLIIKEYLEESFGIELKVSKGFVREVAKKAVKIGTNARELKPIIKEAMKEALEEIFNGRRAKVLKLRKETVTNNKKYYFE